MHASFSCANEFQNAQSYQPTATPVFLEVCPNNHSHMPVLEREQDHCALAYSNVDGLPNSSAFPNNNDQILHPQLFSPHKSDVLSPFPSVTSEEMSHNRQNATHWSPVNSPTADGSFANSTAYSDNTWEEFPLI